MDGGSVGPFDNPASYARVLRRVQRLWDEGTVVFTEHAERQMRRRRIDALDVQNIIRYGSIVSHTRDRREERWHHRVQGATVAGRTTSVVAAIVGQLVIVTVLDE